MSKNFRAGPWSRKEKEFIANNCTTMTPEEIAAHLGRNAETVKKYIVNTLGQRNTQMKAAVAAEYDIQRSPIWVDLRAQFDGEELNTFLYHWRRIVGQFNNDVFPTEELQIIDLIKADLLMVRALKHERRVSLEIKELEAEAERIKLGGDLNELEFGRLAKIENQVAFLYASLSESKKEYLQLQQRKDTIFSKIKGTREQRIKDIESNKETLIDWLKELMTNAELRKHMGERIEQQRLAIDKERARLSEYHQYVDGTVDKPLLNHETVE